MLPSNEAFIESACEGCALSDIVSYCPEDGVLTWLERPRALFLTDKAHKWFNRQIAGKPALSAVNVHGYLAGRIFKKHVLAHRLAWRLYHGTWPLGQIDHINGLRSDNRISNLRVCLDRYGNKQNGPARKSGRGRYKGAFFAKGSWFAAISANGRRYHLGSFASEEGAARAYDDAARERHGEFACVNFPRAGERSAINLPYLFVNMDTVSGARRPTGCFNVGNGECANPTSALPALTRAGAQPGQDTINNDAQFRSHVKGNTENA